jgi:NADH:ubiquinone oxidoreductase subunit K
MGFDNGLVLLRSVKTVSVVMFCVGDIGMLVNRCVPPVLLMAIEDRFTYEYIILRAVLMFALPILTYRRTVCCNIGI